MSLITKEKLILTLILVLTVTYAIKLLFDQHQVEQARIAQAQAEYKAVEDYFNKKCNEEAGYFFYKVIYDIEGIQLPKLRHHIHDGDMMAPGAAFARESFDDAYIFDFLIARESPDPKSVSDNSYFVGGEWDSSDIHRHPGFRFVDVLNEKTGNYERYTQHYRAVGKKDVTAPMIQRELDRDPNYDLNIYRWVLEHETITQPARYAVTFEDSVIPEDRALGIASSRVKVIDTETNEVLAEMNRYVWGPSKPTGYTPNPWLTTDKCPGVAIGAESATRQFVDRVLVAKGATMPLLPGDFVKHKPAGIKE